MQLAPNNLYQTGGWVNPVPLLDCDSTFIFGYGARGIGKTYGLLTELRKRALNGQGKFILLRRQQTQADFVGKQDFSPFKPIDTDNGFFTEVKRLDKFTSAFYVDEEIIGYVMALSTITNIRGFDGSDVEVIFYDEFIPEKHARPIKNESDALWNAYETINRNRELFGRKPLKLIGMSNANDISNEIFLSLGVVDKIDRMKRKGQNVYINNEKSLAIVDYQGAEISDKKKQTALYKLTEGSDFQKMAIENEFLNEFSSEYRVIPLQECVPLVIVGEICIYTHKSLGKFYVSMHKTGTAPEFGSGNTERQRFKNSHFYLWQAYLTRRVIFESRLAEILFVRYFDT